MSTGETRAYAALTAVLKRTRKQCGLTQVALAALLDKPQSYVSKYESGERRLDVIEFLAIAQKNGGRSRGYAQGSRPAQVICPLSFAAGLSFLVRI